MILLSHPTGNSFVRSLLAALQATDQLQMFYTTLGCSQDSSNPINNFLTRRTYAVPQHKLATHPYRELIRLLAPHIGLAQLTTHDHGWASIDAVYRCLDAWVAQQIQTPTASTAEAIYAYEDAAADSFQSAKKIGMKCIYELPIAYWQTSQKLLQEESQRYPQWECTLGATRDSELKRQRKQQEIELANTVICPSQFVLDSLPVAVTQNKRCLVAPFGSPLNITSAARQTTTGPLRLLFAGSMSQRKGLADVFAAMKLLQRADVQLIVMGSPLASMDFYRSQYPDFIYEAPRPHEQVLELMKTCHALVLPSIVEGRALVQQEAMSCGLPLIITPNTGGDDLIVNQETGFLVPIRQPEMLAEKFTWLAEHRELLPEMGAQAQRKAQSISWENYQQIILAAINKTLAN